MPQIVYLTTEYDFIIVGAGTAGCAVANRLSEVSSWKVLLIEAGSDENFWMDIPIFANYLQFLNINWGYKTEPSTTSCLGMEKGQCNWPRGKVMGGSSVLNYMIYTRGNRRDFDQWEALGNTGWGWSNVSYYYKKMENMKIPEFMQSQHHGNNGYLTITGVPYKTPISEAFIKAGESLGQPITNFNGATQTGLNYLQVTMKNGTRWSSARAYLNPISNRRNLYVKKFSTVTKVLIDPKTKVAYGVEYVKNNKKYIAKARKEVIISAGTINSPQILMLSGIGPKKHLREKNIKVIKNAKVGYNLQDHTATGGLSYLIDYPYSLITSRMVKNQKHFQDYLTFHNGPFSVPGGCEALAFLDLQNMNDTDGYPDLELLLVSGGLTSDESLHRDFNIKEKLYREMYGPIAGRDLFMILPLTMRPKSTGRIMLRDNDPFHHPLIYPNYFSDTEGYDIKLAVAGIRMANKVVDTKPFKKLGAKLYARPLPPCEHLELDSDEYWECYARHLTFTIYHHVGTCKMGPASDPDAVVDERLRVRGIKNLRVMDASVMPFVPAAHTNAPTFMIAEKGSDMIKEDWAVPL
ncbi:hypothetical protein RUM44_012258 [Polyplax serrata]|uniref:Glucose-methanol-choline oxidoreductase N-terminal domain-containing protein n=1 Tax=Polyplax serrata TaxID=468196 RepID=A0ABR1BEQ7_POLSC